MNEQTKLNSAYSKIYYCTSMLHAAYIVVFLALSCPALAVLNCISAVVYLVLGTLAKKAEKLNRLFIACYCEIMVFSSISSVFVGWECGFGLYILGILPLLFYSFYLLKDMDFRLATKYCVYTVLFFYFTMFLCFMERTRVYHIDPVSAKVIYTINATVSMMILIGFLYTFCIRVKSETKELTQENTELEVSAKYDALTNLLNRHALDECLDMNLRLAESGIQKFSVLMCDIDDFKKVNDNYGHECGDLVLINVAKVLKSALRDNDLVFRWGGEEILILLAEDAGHTVAIAERCRDAVEKASVEYKGESIRVTVSIGCCPYFPGATKDDIISIADEKMYFGKRNGKNQVNI